jgi:hypothetical protein
MAIRPITPSVRAAFFDFGGLNALTPFEIACECRGSRSEGPQDDEQRHRADPDRGRIGHVGLRAGPGGTLDHSGSNQHVHGGHERIGREGEHEARLPHSPEIGQRQEEHTEEGQGDLVRLQTRRRGGEREDPRGDGDGDGEDVVDEQGGGGQEARKLPQVVPCDDVRPSARLVGAHGLPVGKNDDCEQGRDGGGDRKHEVRRGGRGRDENDEGRLRRIGNRRKWVGGEDGQRKLLREQRLVHLSTRARPADERTLHGDGPARTPLAELGHFSPPSSARMAAMRSFRVRAGRP